MEITRRLRPRGADRYEAVVDALDRIAALDRGRGADPDQSKAVRKRISAELGPVREHLARYPEDTARVHADVHARGLGDRFPWRRLNRGAAHDLAVLYCFTPYLDTSALVAARRLQARGVVTDVISQQIDDARRVDPSSERIAREFLDETRVIPGASGFVSWQATTAFVEAVLAEVADLETAKGPYRTLYTRSMAPQSHFAGAILKIRRPDLRWTAEFSDPHYVNAYGEVREGDVEDGWLLEEMTAAVAAAGFAVPATRRMFSWAELITYALADEVLFTNDQQRSYMLEHNESPELAARAATIASVEHHPTLPETFYRLVPTIYPLDPGLVNIGYFGAFYGTRGLDEVVEALTRLEPDERARVRLHVFTAKPGKLQRRFEEEGNDDVVTARPYVPYLKFLNLTTRFDVLLVNDYATRDVHPTNPYLPAKVSDYRGSGTPIWAVQEPGSVLSTLPAAYTSELGDVDGALAALRAMIADRTA